MQRMPAMWGGRSRAVAAPISGPPSWKKLKTKFKKGKSKGRMDQGISSESILPALGASYAPLYPSAQSPPLSPAPLTHEAIATLSAPNLRTSNDFDIRAAQGHVYPSDVRSMHSSSTTSSHHVSQQPQHIPRHHYPSSSASDSGFFSSNQSGLASPSQSGFIYPGSRSRSRPSHPPPTLTFSRRPRTANSADRWDLTEGEQMMHVTEEMRSMGVEDERAQAWDGGDGIVNGRCGAVDPVEKANSSTGLPPPPPPRATRPPLPPVPRHSAYTITPSPYMMASPTYTVDDETPSPRLDYGGQRTEFIPTSPRQKLRVMNLAQNEEPAARPRLDSRAPPAGPLPQPPTGESTRLPRRQPLHDPYNMSMLEADRVNHTLLRRLSPPNSPTFYDYDTAPPTAALDLGCGAGHWLLDVAQAWQGYGTRLTGMDIVDLTRGTGLEKQATFVRGDFLRTPLPFPDGSFDLVRMANLTLAIPRDAWESLLHEVSRVLALGGRLELIEDRVRFPPRSTMDNGSYHSNGINDNLLELERAYVDMLDTEYGVDANPRAHLQGLMEDIFGHQRVVCALHLATANEEDITRRPVAIVGDAKRLPVEAGLVLLPSSVGATSGSFIPMSQEEADAVAARQSRGLLAARDRLIEYIVSVADAEDAEDARQAAAEALWEYERQLQGEHAGKPGTTVQTNVSPRRRLAEPALPESPTVLPPPPFQSHARRSPVFER
uniref:Methyltransferase domain-containing protein n=1 Tax=Schizophyllum commune (strain H4-8 / FGSC 9210) TaxID=578458 RepID=D8Q2W4_SCHCM